jgi:nitroimidazol reductase NimA-like FMN-containing flavoprotein (pyridoxamine 5'-phosphate oxidase superfamily)
MRRSDRQLLEWGAIEEILKSGRYATLALCRDNEPYLVTLSYGYEATTRSLYFHCAKKGLKTDFISHNPRACATIIRDKGYLPGECGHAYCSVVVRGTVEILTEEQDKERGVEVLFAHLEEDPAGMRAKLRERVAPFKRFSLRDMAVWRLVIEEASGKEGS